MDRPIIYTSEQGRSIDFLFAQRATMIGLGKLAQVALGSNTIVRGLAVSANSPAALNVLVGLGEIYSLEEVDATSWGSLPADVIDFIVKQGLNMAVQTISTPAPTTAGYSIAYLIEAQYQDEDTNPAVLPYYNSANPSIPLSGPNGGGAAQATQRQGVCVIQAKAGVAAATGTQVTPTADSGWTALAVVTVAYGATTVVAGNISVPAGVPQVTSLLQMMQTGSTQYAIDTSTTANQITIALTPPITAYADGQLLNFQAANTNTGPCNINAGPGNIALNGTAGAFQGAEIVAGKFYEAVYRANTGTAIVVGQSGGAQQVNPAIALQHAAQASQLHSAYAVRGLVAQNNTGTPTTKFDASADIVVLRNPTSGTLATRTSVATITNDITVAGPAAGGRDQAAAFPASNYVHWYFIWNGSTLTTISSLSAPPTGPTLPAGYTHWAYICAVILTASSQITPVHVRGSRVKYDGYENSVVGGNATSQVAVSVATLIPPNALMFSLSIRELAGSSDVSGKLDITLNLGVVSGIVYDAKHLGVAGVTAGTSQFCAPGQVEMPNIGQNYYYYMTLVSGTGPSTTHLVTGYEVPNGAC